jgi:hypothetical protein
MPETVKTYSKQQHGRYISYKEDRKISEASNSIKFIIALIHVVQCALCIVSSVLHVNTANSTHRVWMDERGVDIHLLT